MSNIHEKYEKLCYVNIFHYLLIVVVVKYSLLTNPRWRKTEMVQKRQFISTDGTKLQFRYFLTVLYDNKMKFLHKRYFTR